MKMEMLEAKGSRSEISNGAIKIPAGSSAQLLFVYENEGKENKIKLEKNSSLQVFSIFRCGSKIKNSFSLGENSKLEICDIFYGGVEVENSIPMESENCSLNLIAKGAIRANESFYLAFASIGKNASKAVVNLEEHAFLLGKGAKAKLLPGLEIRNNDVVARHASSVSELDKEQIFYLMSRGLSEKEAEEEIISGFMKKEKELMKEKFGFNLCRL